jgi:hypothetical protein
MANAVLTALKIGSPLSDDDKCQPGHHAKDDKKCFEQSEERVHNQVKLFPGNLKPFALSAIDKIGSQQKKHRPKNQDADIDNGAPHEKQGECMYIHFIAPFTIRYPV